MKATRNTYEVIVIGGGASGLMAAAVAGMRGKRVLLLEKNKKLGEKLRISGGGRCNILNAEEDERALLEHFGSSAKFLFSAFSRFGMQATWDFFEKNNLPLMIEDRKRAFPQSENAEDVCALFERLLKEGKVEVRKNSPVTDVVRRSGKIVKVTTEHEDFSGDAYIFATGGFSHPETGSTGDGFPWLTRLGHTVVPPRPTIVPLKTKETWSHALSGKTLHDVSIGVSAAGVRKFSTRGDVLLTHFGVSGPLILNIAEKVDTLLYEGVVQLHIDLFPDYNLGELDVRMQEVFDAHKNKTLRNALKELLPPGTVDVLCEQVPEVEALEEVHTISRSPRKSLGAYLKDIPLTVTGLMGMNRAVVADGGVPLEEVDMRTMQSKKVENLFITGDLLNITRPSGGFSLQLCWTTGFLAGDNA